MFSWYQIESDSAASPVSCKSYLASTDSETFAAVITFHSCKNALSQYFRPPCRSDKTLHSWIYFLKLDRIVFYSLRTPTYRCFFCLFFNAVLFFVPNRVGVGVVSRGIQTGSANCIYCERNVEAGGREGCRETQLPFMQKKIPKVWMRMEWREKKAHGGRKSELPDWCRLSRSAWLQSRVFKFVGKCPEEWGHVSGADKNHHHRVIAFTPSSRGGERKPLRRGRKSVSRL